MDPRGPPEGAPVNSFEIPNIDKVSDTSVNWSADHSLHSAVCEQPKKMSNKLLFLTVEYVEDQSREYPRLFPTYEQVSFSPRATSPLSDFEHRVSPLDPNMSSAARYSPTPVQLPPSPFHNSVVVLQGPSSPLISPPESNERTNVNYVSQMTHPIDAQSVQQTDNTPDFVANENEEQLVSSVGSELILMQETNSGLESPAAPLMLTGMPSTDFTLSRDFLVMQDDQMNVMNSFKAQNLDVDDSTLSSAAENSNKENKVDPLVKPKDQDINEVLIDTEEKKDSEKQNVRRSKRRINDKKSSCCDEGDDVCTGDNCTSHNVCTIADQPVPSRAIATLPGSYLSINKLSSSEIESNGSEYGVFAKRYIQKRTQFGPIEGILYPYDGTPFKNELPLLYETENEELLKVDVSNENASNWMRFVRPALAYKEQNLVICQQRDGIVFLTTRHILPKEELKAGPSTDYAIRRNLTALKPVQETKDDKEPKNQLSSRPRLDDNHSRRVKVFHGRNLKEKENSRQNNSKEWKCSVCGLIFRKAILLNLHTLTHGADKVKTKIQNTACPQCGLRFQKQKELVNHVSQHGRLSLTKTKRMTPLSTYKCSMCYKRFATKVRLQQHCLVHGAEDQKPLPCNICFKRFMNNSALSCHLKTHRENKQVFECPMCRQLFSQSITLKDHIETHKKEDGTFCCPYCQRIFMKYSVIRKHIRAHHCERKHKCQVCAKRFATVDKLQMHLLKHSDHREFHCANCGKQFKRKDKLKEHMTKLHNSQTATEEQMSQVTQTKKFVPKVNPNDYNRFIYKCHQCLVGFKRRGMLVNHLAKRHPDVAPESVPELNLPILRQTRDYYCQYCDKVYKSSSKRKAHIMKNHPGAALPPSNRQKESDYSDLPNPTFSQTVGSITTTPQGCQWCHKQYASKAKLLQHQRKKHSNLMEPADQVPRSRNRQPQNQNQPPVLIEDHFVLSDYIQACDTNSEFFKPKIIKLSEDVDLISNGLELVGQQFVRMRDIR
ncbi:PR domain zinc finger protein 10 [Nomia melanderi]|uniref:PR domain zinc finger protein 10 n=1 Tax=Nomia melanderi TaxID=2448451 RepID=UPI0013047949|nr:PR domain zinc finger protein 10-like [Nomia melanderi]XP_031829352.1 PR domain zinc finger protein 10-like [Nomia melanderi]XP_031829353.1 PR domain zinc finger protein 10-like [Nomia melanderi]